MPIARRFVTTAFTFDGYRIADYHGVVRGITVRSRNIVANIGAGIQTLFGGNITLYSELCERWRKALPRVRGMRALTWAMTKGARRAAGSE